MEAFVRHSALRFGHRAIMIGGIAAGLLDIVFAIVRNGSLGIPAEAVLQSIASGILGRAAYVGGHATAIAGLLLHFGMTLAMAALFVALYHASAMARRFWIASGMLFGAIAYAVMNFLVVPLSRFPAGSLGFNIWVLAAHIFLVGLPIAIAARFLAFGGSDPA